MGETPSAGSSGEPSAGFDLSQFYQVFFEEAGENLDRMEQLLLGLDIERADDETLNAVFRCAHSIKGGAATFGFADVAELTHRMETLLDRLRRHELAPTAPMVDVLLASGDALRAQLARHQAGGGNAIDTSELLVRIDAMCAGRAPAPAPWWRASCERSASPAPSSTSTIGAVGCSSWRRSLSSSVSIWCVSSAASAKPKVAAPPLIECAQRKIAFSASSSAASTSSAMSCCSIRSRFSPASSKKTW